jgi:hypothetical protein
MGLTLNTNIDGDTERTTADYQGKMDVRRYDGAWCNVGYSYEEALAYTGPERAFWATEAFEYQSKLNPERVHVRVHEAARHSTWAAFQGLSPRGFGIRPVDGHYEVRDGDMRTRTEPTAWQAFLRGCLLSGLATNGFQVV